MQHSQDNLLVANCVAQLMDRHQVPRQKHAGTLAKTLGLSFAQAHRKMRGQSNWTFIELKQIADAFGEPITVLVDSPQPDRQPGTPALLDVGSKLLPCVVWLGGEVPAGRSPEYVAVHMSGVWRIYSPESAPVGIRHVVELIEIRPRPAETAQPAVAVVDDDGGRDASGLKTADTICLYLNEKGFDATPYYDASSFRKALRHTRFDAFVVDWLLGTETAEAAISDIRQTGNPKAPVFILTGQLEAGNVNESEIARVITAFDVNVLEKPARLPLLAAEISKRLMAK
ncbi:helix-turn-helix domain-containing protein [Paraburkholderia susongensis]|uniref:BetR domain-containing protein n=1 Tax=Paraburkholderia susongensis TaxID=1515439 RepID=A0A1X7LT78_9BURK|nr:helix-turn-helix domain-containing protein [Paraburkholderia susongensis]SMG57088.1 BetR domain-containing protein [Paraburkholderia susongensis]